MIIKEEVSEVMVQTYGSNLRAIARTKRQCFLPYLVFGVLARQMTPFFAKTEPIPMICSQVLLRPDQLCLEEKALCTEHTRGIVLFCVRTSSL